MRNHRKQEKKLFSRIADHSKGPQGKDRSAHLSWDKPHAAYHRPGSNKK